ncbi:MAG: hypothetical protein QXQ05_05335 [Candidatus Jordarchaeales archaeon]
MDNLKGKIVLLISGGEQPLEEPRTHTNTRTLTYNMGNLTCSSRA